MTRLLCRIAVFALAGWLGVTESASSVGAVTISGRVFLDRNRNGQPDPDEPGLAGVAVSDGREVVQTSKSGDYRIETEPGRFVFVSLPRGYRASGLFYDRAVAGMASDFALAEWPQAREGAVRFAQITDIHVTDTEDRAPTFVDDIEELNDVQPDLAFVLATGDLVNAGKKTNEFGSYMANLRHFRMPVFNLPGNHDTLGSLPHYHLYLGPDYYSFNVGDCHFVLLNSLAFDSLQKAWIEKDLAAAPKQATRVFALHFLPTPQQVRYIAQLGGVAVLSGHWHGHRVQEHEGVLDLNTPPLRFGGIDRHPRGFRIVEVKGGKVTNVLRLGGFNHHAVIVSPTGDCQSRSLPIVVNAYDSRFDVASVACTAAGRSVSLKQLSPWSWMGTLKLPGSVHGPQTLVAEVRASCGEVWRSQTAFNPETESTSPRASGNPLRLEWAAPTGGFIGISSPQAGRNCVAVGIDDHGSLKQCGVVAFALDGTKLWHFHTDSAIKNNIAAADGLFFATSVAGWLYAIDERSGKLQWKRELVPDRQDRWEIAATTAANGIVHVGAHSYLAAFDARTGKRLWDKHETKTDWWPSSYTVPRISQNRLLLATRTGLFALDRESGALIWKRDGHFNGCLIAGNRVYTIKDDLFTALQLADGQTAWSVNAKVGDTASVPAISGDRLVLGTADGRVCAFSAQEGSPLWSVQTGPSLSSLQPYIRRRSDVNSSPAIRGDTVFIGASDGRLHALSLASGAESGSYALGVPIASSPLIVGDRLYVGGYDGNLYCFALSR